MDMSYSHLYYLMIIEYVSPLTPIVNGNHKHRHDIVYLYYPQPSSPFPCPTFHLYINPLPSEPVISVN